MLFNSYSFILLFLPIAAAGFFLIGRSGRHTWAIAWLVFASLLFYGLWNPIFLSVIFASILFNYGWGMLVDRGSKSLLAFGIAANLGLLGYFKYAGFFIENLSSAINVNSRFSTVISPRT